MLVLLDSEPNWKILVSDFNMEEAKMYCAKVQSACAVVFRAKIVTFSMGVHFRADTLRLSIENGSKA